MATVSADFELGRRLRETRNEKIVHAILGGVFLLMLAVQLAAFARPDLPVRPPVGLMAVEAALVAICALVLARLQLAPTYQWWRKYLLTGIDLAAFVAIGGATRGLLDPTFLLLMPVVSFMLVIVLAGLRYSTGAVIFAGVASIAGHISNAAASDLPMRIPVLATGTVFLAGTTATVAYVVTSLVRLHRQAVAKDRLRRFFPPEVVDQIEGAREVTLGAVEREVTVLFADISGFTAMSSKMTPAEIVRLLNDYFPTMVEVVFAHGGTLEKYIGDALLAVWGAPVPWPDAADRALEASVAMQRAAADLNRRWQTEGRPTIGIHIGVHTGRVAAGHIGTDDYIQYACIGDTTNLASRICGCASSGEIVLSSVTRARLTRTQPPLEPLPPATVKGKEEPLELYRAKW